GARARSLPRPRPAPATTPASVRYAGSLPLPPSIGPPPSRSPQVSDRGTTPHARSAQRGGSCAASRPYVPACGSFSPCPPTLELLGQFHLLRRLQQADLGDVREEKLQRVEVDRLRSFDAH